MSLSISSQIQESIESLANKMLDQKMKLSIAESCTGGMLAQWITSLSGSSRWFESGFVTYSNASKIRLLGVQSNVLNEYGAVSQQVAEQMALGALKHSDADISVSITGIAGPDGGSDAKPVGTVYIATAQSDMNAHAMCYLFNGDRDAIRQQSTHAAIQQLIELIK